MKKVNIRESIDECNRLLYAQMQEPDCPIIEASIRLVMLRLNSALATNKAIERHNEEEQIRKRCEAIKSICEKVAKLINENNS